MNSDSECNAPTVAYIVSRFPSATETFIVNEIIALEALGHRVQLFSLRKMDVAVHSAPADLVERCIGGNRLGLPALARGQLHWMRRRPVRWLTTWSVALWENRRSPRFLARALVVVPIAMAFAPLVAAKQVHAHWATHPALAAWVIRRLTGTPYSVTVHAHDLYVDRSMLARKLTEAGAVVTISDFNSRLIERLLPKMQDKVRVVPCGVDTLRLRQSVRPSTVPHEVLRLVCVASLQDYKGHEHLLRACRLMTDEGITYHLDLYGDGELKESLVGLAAQLGVASAVTFHGARPNDEVVAAVSVADVAVLPSIVTPSGKMEGVPVALMEALALGIPVVASDLSGISELVVHQETGLLVPPAQPGALAAAVSRLAGDPSLRARLAREGRRRVEERYDLSRNARDLANVLSAVSA